MNEQIKAGSDIHAGDGGYGIGTKENYDAFVKVRNKSLAAARIKQLAEQAKFMAEEDINRQISYNAELKAFVEKFAELIVKECITVARGADGLDATHEAWYLIQEHFGVDVMSTEDKKTLIKELLGVKND